MTQNPQGFCTLANSERPPVVGTVRVSSADPKETLSLTILVRQRPDGPSLPDRHALTVRPPTQRQYLSHDEIAAKYGAAQADLDQVAAFAQSQGLTVAETSIARRAVVVSGTVEQINRAFAVDLGNYQSTSTTYRGFEGTVHIPTSLDGIIEGVYGLDNRPLAKPMIKRAATGQAVTPLTPAQVAQLYQFPAISAVGQTIGILEFGGGYQLSDIQAYFNNIAHLPVPNVTWVGIDGATNSPGADADIEVIIDIDVAGSVAPSANIVVYFAPNTEQGMIDAITTALNDTTNNPAVISISWGNTESSFGSAIAPISQAINSPAAWAGGITFFVASGDDGSENPAQVEYPASDPGVTGCGGTTIKNVSGSSFTQVAWSGSGGGISNFFPLPDWQTWAGIPPSINPKGHIGRGVPDIAGNADPNSGYMFILNGQPTGLWGGTSAVAPLYAGLVALLNAALNGSPPVDAKPKEAQELSSEQTISDAVILQPESPAMADDLLGERVGYLNYNLYAFPGPYVYDSIISGE